MKTLAFFMITVLAANAFSQRKPAPIIDMHLHALNADDQGPPPLKIGAPFKDFGSYDPKDEYADIFIGALKTARWNARSVTSPLQSDALMQQCIAIMQKRNIYGVCSGDIDKVRQWKKAAPKRIINAVYWDFSIMKNKKLNVDSLTRLFRSGEFKVFGEVAIQYEGIAPTDTAFEPYLKMAEDLDIPLGIHIGPGPPGVVLLGAKNYRAKLHSALLLEEVLVKHPKLRIYVMHAGWPMIDDMVAMLYTYPQLYVDVGVISYILPKPEFNSYMRRLVNAGFGKRIMYGSDQMVWPGAMEISLNSIKNAPFLSADEKRDILFNNAARFLRLTREQIIAMQ